MRFLLDHDVYLVTFQFLRSHGHEVVRVSEIGLAKATDVELLAVAQEQRRLFVTRDRDYGNLVFVKSAGTGVIYLRMLPSDQAAVHRELERVLTSYTEDELSHAFVVVEPDRHRYRRLST